MSRRRSLGSSPEAHADEARRWQKQAKSTSRHAVRELNRRPCNAIEYYTDAIAEMSIAENEFKNAHDAVGVRHAAAQTTFLTLKQREAVGLCQRIVQRHSRRG